MTPFLVVVLAHLYYVCAFKRRCGALFEQLFPDDQTDPNLDEVKKFCPGITSTCCSKKLVLELNEYYKFGKKKFNDAKFEENCKNNFKTYSSVSLCGTCNASLAYAQLPPLINNYDLCYDCGPKYYRQLRNSQDEINAKNLIFQRIAMLDMEYLKLCLGSRILNFCKSINFMVLFLIVI
jgi:hypothetical protein